MIKESMNISPLISGDVTGRHPNQEEVKRKKLSIKVMKEGTNGNARARTCSIIDHLYLDVIN